MARGGWGSATHYRAYLFKAALRHFSHPIQVSNKNLFCRNLYRFSALSCFLRAMTVYHYPLSIIVHYRSLSTFHCQSQKVTWFKKLYSSSNQPLQSHSNHQEGKTYSTFIYFFCCKPHLRLLLQPFLWMMLKMSQNRGLLFNSNQF